MNVAKELSEEVGVLSACEALGLSRATYYRKLAPVMPVDETKSKHFRALSEQEEKDVLDCLNSERFVDKSPGEVYATILDEGNYLCSLSTMYRILRKHNQVRERRNQLQHPNYKKPELLAEKPNQVWSWDITKLLGPQKWTYFYLYVIIDIYSRYVVGWMVAHAENSILAQNLIQDTSKKQNIQSGQLTVHADRGSSMTSKAVGLLLADLGITKTHSRPHVSNDNPFSESQFKTMKYRPEFPDRFGSIQDARAFCNNFFKWYNWEHYHSGIGLMIPGVVHYGQEKSVIEKRQIVLNTVYKKHPERFVKKFPTPQEVPAAVWINPPEKLLKGG
jgi:putative transposase